MSTDDRELRRLGMRLGECLSRLDDQVSRLAGETPADVDPDTLESETQRLTDLIDAVVRVGTTRRVELNKVVESAVADLLQRADTPVVVRQRLSPSLAPVACGLIEMMQALRRAFSLAVRHAGRGGEILVTTAAVDLAVRCTIACSGQVDPHLAEHARTLESFAAELGGGFELELAGAGVSLTLDFPTELAGRA